MAPGLMSCWDEPGSGPPPVPGLRRNPRSESRKVTGGTRMVKEVLKQIAERKRFLLTSHARPDGDAVGSALACGQILRQMGKEAEVVLHDGVPRIYQRLPFADRVV